jgi:LPS-assembly protein
LGKGIWMFNFLDDQASKTFLLNNGYPFQATDRYWVRGIHDFALPWNIAAKIDLDFVSDRNFLQEFPSGSTSFYHTNAVFGQFFGRSLLYDQTSLIRESALYLEKKSESQLLSMDVRYWQNLQTSVEAETTQKLPGFSFSIIPKGIYDTPFYYTLQSSAVNYWRRQGDTDQRLDLYPRVYYPMHWSNYLDVEPSVGVRTNAYAVQWEQSSFDNFNERAIPDARVEMSTRLNREFPVNFWGITAVQNAIRPEVSYEYATQSAAGHIPQIDRLDADQSRNGIRYGFSTFLTGKQVAQAASGEPTATYREIARFRVFQFYNVQSPPVEDPLFDTNNVLREGFSPVGFRMDIMPKRYLTLSYDLDLDLTSAGQGEAQNLYMTFDSAAGQIVRLDYQQIPNLDINEITVATILKTYKDIYLNTYHDYSLERGLVFTQGYGFRYIRGCWGVGAGYERVGSDNRFVFTLDLLGFGSLGETSFFGRPQFGEARPGYQHPETWILSR